MIEKPEEHAERLGHGGLIEHGALKRQPPIGNNA